MIVKNKRGFLLAEETVKIVLALIVITFLIFILFSLYNNSKSNQNKKFAEASIDSLVQAIEREDNNAVIYNPSGWTLISSPYEGKKLNSCSLGEKNCLCICNENEFAGFDFDDCNEDAFCKELEKQIFLEKIISINPPLELNFRHSSDAVYIEQ